MVDDGWGRYQDDYAYGKAGQVMLGRLLAEAGYTVHVIDEEIAKTKADRRKFARVDPDVTVHLPGRDLGLAVHRYRHPKLPDELRLWTTRYPHYRVYLTPVAQWGLGRPPDAHVVVNPEMSWCWCASHQAVVNAYEVCGFTAQGNVRWDEERAARVIWVPRDHGEHFPMPPTDFIDWIALDSTQAELDEWLSACRKSA